VAGELAGGDVVPGQINKWHGGSIELTPSRSVVVARSGGLRRAAATRSRRRARGHPNSGEARGDGDQCVAMGATQESREEFGIVGRRQELAEGFAHCSSGNGGSADGGCSREETRTATYK
jgi:hypothetical protein